MNELVSMIYKQGEIIDIEYNENESPFPDRRQVSALCEEYGFDNYDYIHMIQQYYTKNIFIVIIVCMN